MKYIEGLFQILRIIINLELTLLKQWPQQKRWRKRL